MRNTLGFLAILGLMAASAALVSAQTDPPGRVARLNYMDGPVSFQPAGVNDWIDLTVNRPLIAGDNVWVGDRARAEIHIGSTAMRLGADTAFEFLNLDDRTVQIRLSEGTLSIRMRNIRQDQVFEIDTPNLAFTLFQPGNYRIDADPNSQSTMVLVRDGEGDIIGGGQEFPISARQQVTVSGFDQINYRLASARGPDSWDQWCSSRDGREDQVQSARYVSREMDGYEDLDQYGRWQNEPGYGSVWIPTSVAAGWAPYHDGHWIWIEPWGWTWVDDAPWGFAPFHYGRWASFSGRWGWVPGPYGVAPVYAPALVAWIGGGRGGNSFSLSFSVGNAAAVAWFPLGPREPYIPTYQVSQAYFTRVNTSNTVINNTTINTYYGYNRSPNTATITNIRYANRTVPNAVIAVPQDDFAKGRRVTQDARSPSGSQFASAAVIAAPPIAPQRDSVLGPKAGTASRAPRPPANVLSRPVVARTAPPPAPVPFERRESALAKTPGRPLPSATIQQMRQGAPSASQAAPIHVMDMGRLKRVQPTVAAGQNAPQGTPERNAAPQPQLNGRQNGPPGRQRQQEAAQPTQQPVPQPQAQRPQPQNGAPGHQRRQQEAAQPQTPAPQPQAAQPQPKPQNGPRGRQRQQEADRPQQPAPQPQAAQPQSQAPPPQAERQRPLNGPPGHQRQQEAAQPPQPSAPQPQAAQPQVQRPQPQNGPPGHQHQQEAARPQQPRQPEGLTQPQPQNGPSGRQRQPGSAQPQPSAQQPQSPPQSEPQQGNGKGKQEKDRKSNE